MRRLPLSVLGAAGVSLAALMAASSPAQAQDYTPWNGFYVGGNVGFAWGDSSANSVFTRGPGPVAIPPIELDVINGPVDTSNDTGFAGGLEAGYDYTNGNLLLGIETDINWINVEQRTTNSYTAGGGQTLNVTGRAGMDWMWTLRPRIGYVNGPWLFYLTGGIASTNAELEASYSDTRNPANTATISKDKTETGWVAGLGGGYQWDRNWSVKAEWLYADFGTLDESAASANGYLNMSSEAKVKANVIRVGVDYRF